MTTTWPELPEEAAAGSLDYGPARLAPAVFRSHRRHVLQSPLRLSAPSAHVWHYTSTEALFGICQSQEMWASHSSDLNDASELQYGWHVLQQMWDEHDKTVVPADHRAAMDAAVQGKHYRGDTYILSASAAPNILNQWQHYGAAGVAIGIPASQMLYVDTEKMFSAPGDVGGILGRPWQRVLYKEAEQEVFARYVLTVTLRENAGGSSDWRDPPNPYKLSRRKVLANAFADDLAHVVAYLKHPSFYAEEEYRMVFGMVGDLHVPSRPEMRSVRNGFRGYIRANARDRREDHRAEQFPVKQIYCGPGSDALARARVERLMQHFGYQVQSKAFPRGVQVHTSDLPYVGGGS